MAVLFVCSSYKRSTAAVATWTGSGTVSNASGGVFSIPGNWAGDVLPTFDQTTDVIIDTGSSAFTATNDLGSVALNSLRLTHDTAGLLDLVLAGGSLTFEADGAENPQLVVSTISGVVRIGSNLNLGADLSLHRLVSGSTQTLHIGSGIDGGNIELGPRTLHVIRPNTGSSASKSDTIRIGESGSTTRGIIQGSGRIVVEDQAFHSIPGNALNLELSSQSTYSGGTEVRSGQLALNGDASLANGVVQSGPVGTGPVIMSGGHLKSAGSRRVLENELVVNGSFVIGGTPGPAKIVVAGPIRLNRTSEITVSGNSFAPGDGDEISGPISESTPGTGITWTLFQRLKFTSVCTYTGPTLVQINTLQLNAPGSLRHSPLTLGYKGGLSGDGETGPVTAGADSIVSPGAGVGILRTFGPVQMNDGSTLALEFNSPAVGLGHDQWAVQGTFGLTGTDLQIALGYDPVDFADIFYVVQNDGSDAILGVFGSVNGAAANLSEGGRFSVAGQEFEISYTAEEGIGFAGTGNDIAIRALPEPSSAVLLALCGAGVLARRARIRSLHAENRASASN